MTALTPASVRATLSEAEAQSLRDRARGSRRPLAQVLSQGLAITALLVLLVLAVASIFGLNLSVSTFLESGPNAQRFLRRVGSITFPAPDRLLFLTGITLGIVILGTLMAALISIPVAYLAASNTAPNRFCQVLGRFIGVFARALPDVVLAMVFVLMFSIGSLPGILAIGLHSVGMISKMFADAIEQIDPGPVEAIRAAGGGRMQQFVSGILPQVAPSWVATTLHRNDINLRGSVILGYVGIVGLGYDMANSFAQLDYSKGVGIAIVIFALCVVMEVISSSIRKVMLGAAAQRRSVIDRLLDRIVGSRTQAATSRSGVRRAGASGASAVTEPTGSLRQRGASRAAVAALRRPWTRSRVRNTTWGWVAAVVIVLAVIVSDIQWGDFATFWAKLPATLAKFWPLNFGSYGPQIITGALGETIAIALAATLISLVFSVVIGSLAARNVAPTGGVRGLNRFLLVVIRGIPETILAIMLIIITGLGGQAGALALGFCGIGLLGKLIADSFEEVDAGPERALSATGATRAQVYTAATLPQGRRSLIAHTMYMLDTNIRAGTLLGVVGAGGVGYYLLNASQGANYGLVGVIVLLVFGVVLVVEALSIWLRRVFR
ncbi:phosphonate ABC transporter, permease protein PhnE [Pseudoclavibacter sp. 13-3]|uniref:phosphonate ABC transporter, permease protein PhnE n=1 Tax=Pseudoclavibacter sp. 13-3 TaxID=2901228 RepID=UPI001E4A52B4|nr:phosphonate ABC transporter, permease protein PhnE [Pseudoclavibacter sp. 13-3]MCD7101373.1 phosphonate ABC transporter, permease protein PhnE [Pseudoclavibacter sp. 13-3]